MNMEGDSTGEDEDTSKRASSMSRMTLMQSAAIQPRCLAAFLEKTLKLDALETARVGTITKTI